MATRVNMLKLLQEIRGYAEMANRHVEGPSRLKLPQPRVFACPTYRRRVPIKAVLQDAVAHAVAISHMPVKRPQERPRT